MNISKRQLRKMILEALSDKNKRQQYREPEPGNIASVTLPTPSADRSSEYDIPSGFRQDMYRQYLKSMPEYAEEYRIKYGLEKIDPDADGKLSPSELRSLADELDSGTDF